MTVYKKNLAIFLIGIVGAVFFYCYFAIHANRAAYRIFDFEDSVLWRKIDGKILRINAKEGFDNSLLSKDRWERYDAHFRIYFPQDCGFIASYRDKDYYDAIMINRREAELRYLKIRKGKVQNTLSKEFQYAPVINFHIASIDGFTIFKVNGEEIFKFKNQEKAGRFGFVLKQAKQPPTLFEITYVAGKTDSGRIIHNDYNKTLAKRIKPYLPAFLLAFALGLFSAFCFIRIIGWKECLKRDLRLESLKYFLFEKKLIYLIHFMIAVFIFRDFIFKGSIYVYSTDNYREIFPLFIYSRDCFLNIFKNGLPALWNPFNFNGTPFYSNHWNMAYFPLHWPVFLLRKEWTLIGLSWLVFLEVFFIGVLSYQFLKEEVRSAGWVIAGSIVAQLCSFVILNLTIYTGISLYLMSFLYLFSVWGTHKRSRVLSFTLITLSVIGLMTAANLALTFYIVLGLIVFTIYRQITIGKEKTGHSLALILWASWICGLMISAIRLIPNFFGILGGNRITENFPTIHSRFFTIIRMFFPNIFGMREPNFFYSPNLNFIYRNIGDLSVNNQNIFFVYFGILPAILIFAAFFVKRDTRYHFWKTYVMIALAAALLIQPVWGVLTILFHPMNHSLYVIMLLPVACIALFALSGQNISQGCEEGTVPLRLFSFLPLIILSLAAVIYTYLFPQMIKVMRFVFIILLCAVFFNVYKERLNKKMAIAGTNLQATMIIIFLWSVLLAIALIAPLENVLKYQSWWWQYFILAGLFILIGCYTARKLCDIAKEKGRIAIGFLVVLVVGGVLAGYIFIPDMISFQQKLPAEMSQYLIYLILNILCFFIMVLTFKLIVQYRVQKYLSRSNFIVIVISLVLFDLVLFNLMNEHIVFPRKTFTSDSFPYADRLADKRDEIDLTNYRINNIHRAGYSFSTHLIYHYPVYTGSLSYIPRRYSRLLSAFGYQKNITRIHPEDSQNIPRLLDLLAVKYSIDEKGGIQIRKKPLSRLNIFTDYRIENNEDRILELLTSDSFNIHNTAIIQAERSRDLLESKTRASRGIDLVQFSPDHLEAQIQTDTPAWIVWQESYHPGWRVHVDGQRKKIFRANFNFMAFLVGEGNHGIRLQFLPYDFLIGLAFSGLGLIVFLGGCLIFNRRSSSKNDAKKNLL